MDYNRLLSETAKDIKPSGIRKFFDVAAEMPDCIALGVGEPDFKTPQHIRQVAIDSLRRGETGYSANSGLMPLRREISAYMKRRMGVEYDPVNQIVVTVGGSEGIDNAIRAMINPGDEVLVPEPSFVCYSPLTRLAGGVPVALPTYEKDGFRLTAENLKKAITPKTKLLILPFPNNPTGAVMTREDYETIAEVLAGTDVLVLADEIYIELNYTGAAPVSFSSIKGMYDRTVVVNGFSKTYAMTGWRIGWLCGPKEIVAAALKVHQYAIMCAPTTSQHAAIEALRNGDEDIEYMRSHYNMRRRFLLENFRRLGIPCFEPHGAFYVFPNISGFGMNSDDFCNDFLKKAHVAVVPGTAFGDSGEGFVRISYAYSMEHLKKAVERLEKYMSGK